MREKPSLESVLKEQVKIALDSAWGEFWSEIKDDLEICMYGGALFSIHDPACKFDYEPVPLIDILKEWIGSQDDADILLDTATEFELAAKKCRKAANSLSAK